jgi:hypothetical protein
LSKAKLAIALSTLTVLCLIWAVSITGAAHQRIMRERRTLPTSALSPIGLREDRGRGLLVDAWIEGAGPFSLVLDTGAGVTIISDKVVQRATLHPTKSARPIEGGLSSTSISSNQEARISKLALGNRDNTVSSSVVAAVVQSLPGSIDGILDPTQVFGSLSYSIDLPRQQLVVFDSGTRNLKSITSSTEGCVVPWIKVGGSHRPFVRLDSGQLALIDTGSGFGLAFSDNSSQRGAKQGSQNSIHDLGGGRVETTRVEAKSVSIGSLVLRNVPTDLIRGAAPGTPVIIGRRALHPFKLTFDPVARLIAIETSDN